MVLCNVCRDVVWIYIKKKTIIIRVRKTKQNKKKRSTKTENNKNI